MNTSKFNTGMHLKRDYFLGWWWRIYVGLVWKSVGIFLSALELHFVDHLFSKEKYLVQTLLSYWLILEKDIFPKTKQKNMIFFINRKQNNVSRHLTIYYFIPIRLLNQIFQFYLVVKIKIRTNKSKIFYP